MSILLSSNVKSMLNLKRKMPESESRTFKYYINLICSKASTISSSLRDLDAFTSEIEFLVIKYFALSIS